MTTKSRPTKYAKRTRPRAPQRPDAIAFTIAGFQSMGGPGKTSVYELGKTGKLKLFKDPLGRTLIDGDSARAYLSIKDEAAA